MPTNDKTRRKRFITTGHFDERPGYRVDRPTGCHDWLLIYTVRGGGTFSCGDETFSTGPHEAVIVAPRTPHRYAVAESTKRWELLWAHFLPPTAWRTWLKWDDRAKGWGRVKIVGDQSRSQVLQRFNDSVNHTVGYRTHREALALNALEAVLLCCHEQVAVGCNGVSDPRLVDVLNYVCRHLNHTLDIEELASLCHLSPSRFSHLFREQMQLTPRQFVEQQRIERARDLLEHTGYSVASIARQIGFENPFYFTRRFKQAVGKSPRLYRQTMADNSK